MGAADFHDAVKVQRLLGQRAAQLFKRRQQAVCHTDDRREVHRRGKHVIRRLAAVHVVIGMHAPRVTTLTPQQLTGAVGQHFVHVHIGLRPGTGLPNHQRELIRMPAGNDLIGGVHNGPGFSLVLQSQRQIDQRR